MPPAPENEIKIKTQFHFFHSIYQDYVDGYDITTTSAIEMLACFLLYLNKYIQYGAEREQLIVLASMDFPLNSSNWMQHRVAIMNNI